MVETPKSVDFWDQFRLSQNPSGSIHARERASRDARRIAHSILSSGDADELRVEYTYLEEKDPFMARSAYDLLRKTWVMESAQLRETLGMPPRRNGHR